MIANRSPLTVAVWRRFGPYHFARLEAARKFFAAKGAKVIGIETASTDSMHQWAAADGDKGEEHKTLFPGAAYDDLSRRQIAGAVRTALDRLDPAHVAIGGWSSPDALAALGWCRKNRRSAVLMSESKFDDAPRTKIKEWMKSRIVKRFHSALVGGTPHQEYVVQLGMPAGKVFLGYDVVDNSYFFTESEQARRDERRLRSELGLPDFYILAAGRFLEVKNFERLLAAYELYRARSNGPPMDLVICGGGALEDHLKEKASGIPGILWPGFQQIEDLPKYYGLASAFIVPSTMEPWGLVVNEAMACSLPVLSSNVVGARYDLIRDGVNGFLFDPYAVDEMAEAMVKLTALPEERRLVMGVKSRRIVADWGPDRFAEMLWQAIEAGGRF